MTFYDAWLLYNSYSNYINKSVKSLMSLEFSFEEEKVGEGEPDTSFHESLVLPRESCVAVSAIQNV